MKHRMREGYVLVATLLIIAMVGILTVGLARHSMNLAIASIEAEEDLQTKWGVATCQRFALSSASTLLSPRTFSAPEASSDASSEGSAEDATTPASLPRSVCSIALGKQVFHIRLDDESAKLDLNHVLEHSSQQKVKELARKFFNSDLNTKLLPLNQSRRRMPTEDAFECWGQVFAPVDQVGSYATRVREASKELTCWSHRVNFRNCSDKVLLESVKLIAGASTAQRLVKLRKDGVLNVEDAIEQTQVRASQKNLLQDLLIESSNCYSVWVESESGIKRRHFLTIRESVTGTLARYYSFSW